MNRFIKWNRRRRFNKAYRILRLESERHEAANHRVKFIAVNEANIILQCSNCPDLQPMGKRRKVK